ncbi:UNVERIFIED_CONTAM: hypothetical protein Sangu_2795100 [Sesamum angustifolium]|uniref:MULE transposase domain-containing protein n=1 Tax=Sesamum angustifolium TaxID=2727405 RepID=A0AAW2ISQ4_9LAMI
MTLTVYYGAHAMHIPKANYVGGSVAKFDYLSAKECCLQSLDKFCDSVGVSKDMRYYIILNKEFKLILNNNDIRKEYKSRLLHREMIVYVESLERVEGERDDYVAEGAVVTEKGVEGAAGTKGGEGVEGEGGEDEMEEENGSSESEIDVVNNDGDLDEIRDELCNEDRPIYPVFNLEQIWELTFELGMRLWDYAEEIRVTNPGSTVIVGTNNENGENRFSRLYVCFGALKVGFKYGYRPIIGVDGCHLKGPHGGILLTACGVDPNNSLFPIAYAVVNKESREVWEWFFIILKHDLNIVRHDEFTFMSDKQKGLIQALDEVLLGSEYKFCVRHLHNNFKLAGFRGLAYKTALWAVAKACTVGEWKMKIVELKAMSHAAFDWFNDKPTTQWSRSHFSEIATCDMLLNNVCETFKACILEAREKPILTILEWIREYLMRRLQENKDRAASKWKGKICPKI